MVCRGLFLWKSFGSKFYSEREKRKCFIELCNFIKQETIEKSFSHTEPESQINNGIYERQLAKVVKRLHCKLFFCWNKTFFLCRLNIPVR